MLPSLLIFFQLAAVYLHSEVVRHFFYHYNPLLSYMVSFFLQHQLPVFHTFHDDLHLLIIIGFFSCFHISMERYVQE